MRKVMLNDKEYDLIKNYKDGFDYEIVKEKFTDYFDEFDYVVGDFSYDKLRLKGFYDESNSKCKDLNNYKNLDNYLKDYCSFECRYFILKKMDK